LAIPPAIVLTLVTLATTFAGGLVAFRYRKDLVFFVAFAAGALIGICFFELLPEAIELSEGLFSSAEPIMVAVVVGYAYYMILQKALVIHSHRRSIHERPPKSLGVAGASGLVLHSFLDGFAIGIAFKAGTQVGLIVSFAVIMHDFSDGLNTITLMLRANNSPRSSLALLSLDALSPLLGAGLSQFVSMPATVLVLLLAFFAGEFLAIGGGDLLPEADLRESSWRILLLTVLGLVTIFGLSKLVSFR